MKGLILAAGEGTRLRPLTNDRPKPMLPINGKPLLEITIEQLRRYGIKDIAINLHYKPDAITDYLGDGRRFGVQITYSYEPKLLGSAGAAKKLHSFLDETFVIIYGDVLTNIDFEALVDFHRSKNALITLSLYRVPNPTQVGLVEIDTQNRVERFQEKPRPEEVFTDLANAGVLVSEPSILTNIPAGQFCDFGHTLLPRLLAAGVPLYGLPLAEDEYLIDIGSPENYRRAQHEWPRANSVEVIEF